jgi:RNA polymerase sigma-70 factor, ECF subfamily
MERVASVTLVGDDDIVELDNFKALVEHYRPRVFRFLLASVRDRDDADMLTQETFLKAYHARSRFRGEASVNTWLMQIAVNALRDHLRNRRWQFWRRTAQDIDASELSDSLPARGASPEAHAMAKQQVAEVWRAASQLPPKQRTVFLLRFVEDMDILEIAAATGSAEGTVKAQLFQALKTIRERLARTR